MKVGERRHVPSVINLSCSSLMAASFVLCRLDIVIQLHIASRTIHHVYCLMGFLVIRRVNIARRCHDSIRPTAVSLRVLPVVCRRSARLIQVSIALATRSDRVFRNSSGDRLIVLAENGQHLVVRIILRQVVSTHGCSSLSLSCLLYTSPSPRD